MEAHRVSEANPLQQMLPMLSMMIPAMMQALQQSQAGGAQPQLHQWQPRLQPLMPPQVATTFAGMGSRFAGEGGQMAGMMLDLSGSMFPAIGAIQRRLQDNANVNPMALRAQREFEALQMQMTSRMQGEPLARQLGLKPGDTGYDAIVGGGPMVAQLLGATGIVQALAPTALVNGGQSLIKAAMRVDGSGQATAGGTNTMLDAFNREFRVDDDHLRFDRTHGLAADDTAELMPFAADNGVRGDLTAEERETAREDGRRNSTERIRASRRNRGLDANLSSDELKQVETESQTSVDYAAIARGVTEKVAPVLAAYKSAMPNASNSELMSLVQEGGVPKTKEAAEAMADLIRRTTALGKSFHTSGEQMVELARSVRSQTGSGAITALQDAVRLAALRNYMTKAGTDETRQAEMTATSLAEKTGFHRSQFMKFAAGVMAAGDEDAKTRLKTEIESGDPLAYMAEVTRSNSPNAKAIRSSAQSQTDAMIDINRVDLLAGLSEGGKERFYLLPTREKLAMLAKGSPEKAAVMERVLNDPVARKVYGNSGKLPAYVPVDLLSASDKKLLTDMMPAAAEAHEIATASPAADERMRREKLTKAMQDRMRTKNQTGIIGIIKKLGDKGGIEAALESSGFLQYNEVTGLIDADSASLLDQFKATLTPEELAKYEAADLVRRKSINDLQRPGITDAERKADRAAYHEAARTLSPYGFVEKDKEVQSLVGDAPVDTPVDTAAAMKANNDAFWNSKPLDSNLSSPAAREAFARPKPTIGPLAPAGATTAALDAKPGATDQKISIDLTMLDQRGNQLDVSGIATDRSRAPQGQLSLAVNGQSVT